MTDEELYRRYLHGDEAGLSALMDRYGSALTLYIDGYLGDIHEAEDLMIEVFSYLLAKRPRIREGCFKAYLYKAARHAALRHKSRRPAVFSLEDLREEPEGKTLLEEVVKDRERSRILHLCMGQLRAEYREALYLAYFEGLSYAQVAEVMGKSVKQVTNMVYRGKQSLRELLKRRGLPMRSNEERVAAVKERVAQRQKRQRRDRVIALASVAASLAVIVGVSFALPGVLEGVSASGYEGMKQRRAY